MFQARQHERAGARQPVEIEPAAARQGAAVFRNPDDLAAGEFHQPHVAAISLGGSARWPFDHAAQAQPRVRALKRARENLADGEALVIDQRGQRIVIAAASRARKTGRRFQWRSFASPGVGEAQSIIRRRQSAPAMERIGDDSAEPSPRRWRRGRRSTARCIAFQRCATRRCGGGGARLPSASPSSGTRRARMSSPSCCQIHRAS